MLKSSTLCNQDAQLGAWQGCGFNFVGVAYALDLIAPETISKRLEPLEVITLEKIASFALLDLTSPGTALYHFLKII